MPRKIGPVALAAVAALLGAACVAFRSSDADRTNWEELPNDPRPELWVQGAPRLAIVFDGVYTGLGGETPAFDSPSTDYFLDVLRRARVFSEVAARDSAPGPALRRARVERLFVEDSHTGSNLTQAVTVPGLLGYRFALTATYKLRIERPDAEPLVYEAQSRITQIYHAAGRADASRLFVYREVDRANTAALVHQMRADPELFDERMPTSAR